MGVRACIATLIMVIGSTMAEYYPIPTTPPEAPWNDSNNMLLVESQSEYCDWERALGPLCVYNTTRQTVVVPQGLWFTSGQLELEIHNASVVKLYPTCVSWIQIYDTGMIHTLPSEEGSGEGRGGRQSGLRCRTWLRIYGSKVGRVEYGVKDLTLQDSEVETIKLTDQRDFMAINSSIQEIEELEWGGYRSTVLNTTIKWVGKIWARDNWYVVNARFGTVGSGGIVFSSMEMNVINSTISHMSEKALTIESGIVSFENVTIAYLEAQAIIVANPHGLLSLTDITIRAAMSPCFILLDRDRVKINNVTIFGIQMNESSPYFQFLDDSGFEKNETASVIQEQGDTCTYNETVLDCNFENSKKNLAIVGEDIKGFRTVNIRNADPLLISSTGCHTDLRLENVNATLPHLTPLSESEGVECNVTITAKNSTLKVVWTKNINNLKVTNSTINTIHAGSLDSFILSESTVEMMYDVEVVGEGAVWTNSRFPGSFASISVTLKAPLTATNIDLPKALIFGTAIVIDHPGKTTKLNRWNVRRFGPRSIVVRKGSRVELSDWATFEGGPEAIYLEEGAKAACRNLRIEQDSEYIFSVSSIDDIEILDEPSDSDLLKGKIHVRTLPPPLDQQSNFTISDSHVSAYCRNIPYYLQICDFTSAPKDEEVKVDFAHNQVSSRVIIKGASSVMLFPSCIEKVILMNVAMASTTENERECGTWLEALGVHLTNVTTGVHDVTLKASTVKLLAPDRRLRDVDLEGTSVESVIGLHWAGYTGVFNGSKLGEVRSLRADSRLMMSNTKILTLATGGMFLAAEAIIVNSTFQEIKTSGMIVNGSTRMSDVTIEKLETGGIKVLDGLLHLVNVNILETEEGSITAGSNGGISFQNVTVGGKKVHWRGYLTRSTNQSVVFLNKHFSGTGQDQTMGETTGTQDQTPQASSIFQWHTTDGQNKATSAPNSLIKISSSATTSSWKWAGAGIGFCVGLLVAFCIFVIVKFVKPNRGMLTSRLPTVFWRVKDDQHELLQDDQGVEEIGGARRDQQGYSVLPRSDS